MIVIMIMMMMMMMMIKVFYKGWYMKCMEPMKCRYEQRECDEEGTRRTEKLRKGWLGMHQIKRADWRPPERMEGYDNLKTLVQ